jgi:hypothetical protein
MYEFKKPDAAKGHSGIQHYNKCKGFIGSNSFYEFIDHLGRQPRIHSCFSYCINGDDPLVIGETRVNCVDLPPEERDKIICLYPEETCEQTTVRSEFGDNNASISPEIAIYAMLICTPLQFIFEFMCIMLAKTKGKQICF